MGQTCATDSVPILKCQERIANAERSCCGTEVISSSLPAASSALFPEAETGAPHVTLQTTPEQNKASSRSQVPVLAIGVAVNPPDGDKSPGFIMRPRASSDSDTSPCGKPQAGLLAAIGIKSPTKGLTLPVKEPFQISAEESRYCAADSELKQFLTDFNLDLSNAKQQFQFADNVLERIPRIMKVFTKGLEMTFNLATPSSFEINERNASLNLWWGLKVESDTMTGSFNCTVPLNIMECCAVEFERDLENTYSLEEVQADMLAGLADDCIWRRRSLDRESGFAGDDIEIVSVVDALDEHGCIMRMKYLPADGQFPYGIDRDSYALDKSAHRSSGQCSFMKLVPSLEGTEVQSVFEAKLPKTIATALNAAPAEVLKKGARKTYECWVASVVPWANSRHGKAEIQRRMDLAPHSQLYKNLAFHVMRHDRGHVQGFPFPK